MMPAGRRFASPPARLACLPLALAACSRCRPALALPQAHRRRRPLAAAGRAGQALGPLAPPAEQAESARPCRRRARAACCATGNRVLVDVRFDHGAAAGVDDAARSRRARSSTSAGATRRSRVAAKPAELRGARRRAAASPASTEVLAPITAAADLPGRRVVSEGDAQLHAAEAARTPSASTAAASPSASSPTRSTGDRSGRRQRTVATTRRDVDSGDLPGAGNPCGQRPRSTSSTTTNRGRRSRRDEGRAMAQIVHDLAPGADLAFATAFNGELAFAENIEAATGRGGRRKVIVDDVGYFEEPFFQDGPVRSRSTKSPTRRHLLLGRRQRQPVRRRRPRNRLLGSAGIPRLRRLPAGGRKRSPDATPNHCLDFDPGAQDRHDLRDHGRTGANADRRPAVGRTVERRRNRPRRLPARRQRQTLIAGVAADRQHRRSARSRSRSSQWENESGSTARPCSW